MNINSNKVIKADMISVPIAQYSTATKFPFPDQPQLRGVFLQSLFIPYVNYDIQGKLTLNKDFALQTCFLVLYFDGKENIQQIPLLELVGDSQNDNFYNINGYFGCDNQVVIWPKSYIVTSHALSPSLNSVITFAISYSTNKRP